MKYALVNNQRVEAQKGMKGICPVCQKPVIARCGEIKVNHWAHTKSIHCDKWWEAETEWHRAWKSIFPEDWQEVISYNEETGEKHVADIKTDKGQVIEFQHSYIKPDEQKTREEFYKEMIWIVDGTRLKRDLSRFNKAFQSGDFRLIKDTHICLLNFPDEYLPKNWLNRPVPVILDFMGINNDNNDSPEETEKRELLWCLLPIKNDSFAVIMPVKRDVIIDALQKGGLYFDYQTIINKIIDTLKAKRQIVYIPRTRRRRKWYF